MSASRSLKVFLVVTILFIFLIMNPTGLVFSQFLKDTMNQDFRNAETLEDYRQFIETYQPNELAFVAVQQLAASPVSEKNWEEAIRVFESYRDSFPGMEERFDKIIVLLKAPERNVRIRNLGPGINTENGEYYASITADGKKLYFTRNKKRYFFEENELKSGIDEDVFVSTYISTPDTQYWSEAESLGEPICTSNPEAPLGISADGNTLLLFGNYPGSLGRGDIFYSQKTISGWAAVQNYLNPINSKYFEGDAMLTADGKAIIFISDKPGAIGDFHPKDQEFHHGLFLGNTDIYVSVKTDSGWAEPINLGTTINTPYSERSPFLHPDGKTLYFSSDGHYGLGGLDVFKATRLSDTSWTEWSEPINMGKEYNSSGIDWSYRISTSGDLAFFSAQGRADSKGSDDIYSIELPRGTTYRPLLTVTTVSGKVTDPEGKPLDVVIKWNDLTDKKEVGEATSDPQNGNYFIPLPAGHKYSYYAEKEGYIGKSEFLDLTDKKEFTEYTLDIILYPVKKDTLPPPIELIVFFDVDKWDLREESFLELDRWVKFLKQNQEIKAEIDGHTDDTGTDVHNDWLSVKRAQAVVAYLTTKDVKDKQLIAKGFGQRFPKTTNETEEGRQKNRRVEIELIEYKTAQKN